MKNNYKRIVSLLLAMVLVLAACSNGGNKKNESSSATQKKEGKLKGEISVQVEDGWKSYYEKIAKKITDANPDAKINFITKGAIDHLDLLNSTDANNKDFADVFAFPSDRFNDLSNKQVLGSIDAKKIAEELGGFNKFDEGLGGVFKQKDEYLAFPMNIETLITYVNSKNAEAEGYKLDSPIELTSQKKPQNILIPASNLWFGVAITNTGEINHLNEKKESDLSKDFSSLPKEKQDVFNALYGYWKAHTDAGTPLFDKEASNAYTTDEFVTGKSGVAKIDGPWAAKEIAEKVGADNLEIKPITHITVNNKPLSHWKGGWALGLNSRIESDKDKVALASEFIKNIVHPENAVELFKSTGKVLENVTFETYEKSDLSKLDKDVIKNVLESYNASESRPLFKEFGSVWSTWENAVLSWNSVKPANTEAAYKEIKASYDAMLSQIKQ